MEWYCESLPQLSNEMQLSLMNKVKNGELTIDDALKQANKDREQLARNKSLDEIQEEKLTQYNFSVHKHGRYRWQKRVLQFDFKTKMLCSIEKGIVKRQLPFSKVKSCDDGAGSRFSISFKDHHDYELEATSVEDKHKMMELVNKIIYGNIYTSHEETVQQSSKPQCIREGVLLLHRGGLASFKWVRYEVQLLPGQLVMVPVRRRMNADGEMVPTVPTVIHLSHGDTSVQKQPTPETFSLNTIKNEYHFRVLAPDQPNAQGPVQRERDSWVKAIDKLCRDWKRKSYGEHVYIPKMTLRNDSITEEENNKNQENELGGKEKDLVQVNSNSEDTPSETAKPVPKPRAILPPKPPSPQQSPGHTILNSLFDPSQLSENTIKPSVVRQSSIDDSPDSPKSPRTQITIPPATPQSPVLPKTPVSPQSPVLPKSTVSPQSPVLPKSTVSPVLPKTPVSPQSPVLPKSPNIPRFGISVLPGPPISVLPPPSSPTVVPPAAPPPPPPLPVKKRTLSRHNITKAFHWDVLGPEKLSKSFWIQGHGSKKIEIDTSRLYEHFAAKHTGISGVPMSANSQNIMLNEKIAHNFGIFLKSFPVPPGELKDKLFIINEEEGGLSDEHITALRRYVPTIYDVEMYKSHKGPVSELHIVDQYMMEMCNIQYLNNQLDLLLTLRELPVSMDDLQPLINQKISMCQQLYHSGSFVSVLEYLLAIGNYLNQNAGKERAKGIRLFTLTKMAQLRGKDKKFTLLHALVEQIMLHQPTLVTFTEELAEFETVPGASIKGLIAEVDVLKNDLQKIIQYRKASKKRNVKETHPNFLKDLKMVIEKYKSDLSALTKTCEEMNNLYSLILVKFGEPLDQDSKELFGIICQFIHDFKKAHAETV